MSIFISNQSISQIWNNKERQVEGQKLFSFSDKTWTDWNSFVGPSL